MASLFQQAESAYWWLRDNQNRRRSLKPLRWDVHADTRKAREICAAESLGELQVGEVRGESWAWLTEWLALRYRGEKKAKTLERYMTAWRTLKVFMDKEKLDAPRQFTHTHAHAYLKWRPNPQTPGIYRCSLNTAVWELKVLGIFYQEAIRRKLAMENPCAKLGVEKTKPDEKPEITEDEIAKIRKGLLKQPEWMRVSFEIGLAQGCRLRETSIPLSDIDLDKMEVKFGLMKGDKPFTTKLNRNLVPLIQQLRARGAKRTCELGDNPSREFSKFFQQPPPRGLGMKHLCFHCTRVTAITWMARGGVPMAQAMRFVNHSTEAVHRIYQRLVAADVVDAVAAVERHGCPAPLDSPPSISTQPPASSSLQTGKEAPASAARTSSTGTSLGRRQVAVR